MARVTLAVAGAADAALSAWAPLGGEVVRGELRAVHAAAPAGWVVRVEPEERPTAALLAALPAALAEPGLRRIGLLRRWLAPPALGGEAGAWLDEPPWWPDAALRLLRTEEDAAVWDDRRALEAPDVPRRLLAAPLACVLGVELGRRERLELGVVREGLDPAGVGVDRRSLSARYDPERHARRPPAAPDAGLDRDDAGPLAPGAAVALRAAERDVEVPAGHGRSVLVAVRNESGDRWAGPGEEGPRHRVSQHVLGPDGRVLAEGPPAELPAAVEPGATLLVPLWVTAPPGATDLVVEAGVVRDDVAWLPGGAVGRFDARVVPAPEAVDRRPAAPPPARSRLPWRRGGARRPAIPRVLHRVWLGGRPLPEQYAVYGRTWADHHPDWELRLWTDADAPRVAGEERARSLAERADLVRYEVLRRHGGVYVDTDVECLRPIDPLLAGLEAFAAYEVPGRVCNAVIGAAPDHPFMADAVALAGRAAGTGHYPSATATDFLTRVAEDLHPEVELLGPERFYPFLWDVGEEPPVEELGEGTYAVHHWAKSWVAGAARDAPG